MRIEKVTRYRYIFTLNTCTVCGEAPEIGHNSCDPGWYLYCRCSRWTDHGYIKKLKTDNVEKNWNEQNKGPASNVEFELDYQAK